MGVCLEWCQKQRAGALVVAQLVERLLLTPEVRGSNPVIGKIYIEHWSLSTNCIDKTKIKQRGSESVEGSFKGTIEDELGRCPTV